MKRERQVAMPVAQAQKGCRKWALNCRYTLVAAGLGDPEIRFKFPHPDHLKALWGGMIDGRLCRR